MQDIERHFFQPNDVSQVLAFHEVSQGAWTEINRILMANAKNVPNLVLAKAARMNPNPLNPPFQWIAASHILKEALFEVFSGTLTIFNINDPGQWQEMFDYLFEKQKTRWVACFGEENPKTLNTHK